LTPALVLLVSAMNTLPSSATSRSSGRLVAKCVSYSAPNRARSLVAVSSSSDSRISTHSPVPSVAVTGVTSFGAANRRRPSGSQRAM
jgi:hypothetical protein